MLFVSKPPVAVYVEEDQKIIMLTSNKLIFSHLDFIEEYLSMPLIGNTPKAFYHAPAVSQTLVRTETTLEVFYCDWKTQIKLLRVVILHN